jgi:hypothetical protein
MNTTLRLRFVFCLVLLAVSIALPALAGGQHAHGVVGTVRALSEASLDLETGGGETRTFHFAETTAFKRGKAAARRQEVEIGKKVVVTFKEEGGKQWLKEVNLDPSAHAGHQHP